MRQFRMTHGDRDATSNRKRKVAMGGSLLAAVAAMTTVGVLAIGGPTTRATFPARNGPIAFVGDKGSGSGLDVYTINRDGTDVHRLTHLKGDESAPDWSPDGARIAFWLDPHSAPPELNMYSGYVMNADSSDLHQVTSSDISAEFPTFTRDGDHLVYDWEPLIHNGQPHQPAGIFLMGDDGSDFPGLRLTTSPYHKGGGGDRNPEVAPDGQTVTFDRIKVGGKLQALCAVDIDGSEVRRLTSYRREVALRHDWAPDGKHIVLTTKADYPDHESPNVATIRPDGSRLRMLTHYSGGERGAFAGSYSPNGRWIVFRVENLEKERFRLYKMHPDGTHRKLIRSLPFAPRFADWGPRP
jgi:Tol biopolymer transport system component